MICVGRSNDASRGFLMLLRNPTGCTNLNALHMTLLCGRRDPSFPNGIKKIFLPEIINQQIQLFIPILEISRYHWFLLGAGTWTWWELLTVTHGLVINEVSKVDNELIFFFFHPVSHCKQTWELCWNVFSCNCNFIYTFVTLTQ